MRSSGFAFWYLLRAAAATGTLGALLLGGCANRDVKPTDAGHPRPDAMSPEVPAEAGGADLAMDLAPGDAPGDGGLSDVVDAIIERPTCPPTARFNFEGGALYGTTINSADEIRCPVGCGDAFTAIANSGVTTYCGTGALEITAAFHGTDGTGVKGEILIPLRGADGSTIEDLTGRTITIHAAAIPASDVSLFLLVSTSTGFQTVPFATLRKLGPAWQTSMNTFTGDGGVMGESTVMTLSLQAFSYTGYQGKIYIDEIDVQ